MCHAPQLSGKRGVVNLHIANWLYRIQKNVTTTKDVVWWAICACAASWALFSSEFKIFDLIGHDQLLSPKQLVVCMVTRLLLPHN